jgi:hypothetical protein
MGVQSGRIKNITAGFNGSSGIRQAATNVNVNGAFVPGPKWAISAGYDSTAEIITGIDAGRVVVTGPDVAGANFACNWWRRIA